MHGTMATATIKIGSRGSLDDYVLACRSRDERVYLVRGERCVTRDEMLGEFSAVLQFPSYFGWNLDAFEECLRDLEWLGDDLILVIASVDAIVGSDDGPVVLDILRSAANTGGTRISRLVFHAEDELAAEAVVSFARDHHIDVVRE